MLTRFASFPGAGALLAAFALTFLSLLASGADGRVRLEMLVLEQSRGRDIGTLVAELECNSRNLLSPCVKVGEPCSNCSTSKYRVPATGTFGGAIAGGGAGDCGSIQDGICDVRLDCVNQVHTIRICTAPPPPLEQEEKGGIGVGD